MSRDDAYMNSEDARLVLRRFINNRDVQLNDLARAVRVSSLESSPIDLELIWKALRKDKALLSRFGSGWIGPTIGALTRSKKPGSDKTLSIMLAALNVEDLPTNRWRFALLKLAQSKNETAHLGILHGFTQRTVRDEDLGFTVSLRDSPSRSRRSPRLAYPEHELRDLGNGQCHPMEELRGTYLYEGHSSAKPRLVLIEYGSQVFGGPDLLDDLAQYINEKIRPFKRGDYCKALDDAVRYLEDYRDPARTIDSRSSNGLSFQSLPGTSGAHSREAISRTPPSLAH